MSVSRVKPAFIRSRTPLAGMKRTDAKKKEPPSSSPGSSLDFAAALPPADRSGGLLLELGLDVREQVVQTLLDLTEADDDADADDRSDKTVLDSGGAGLVSDESADELLHDNSPSFFRTYVRPVGHGSPPNCGEIARSRLKH